MTARATDVDRWERGITAALRACVIPAVAIVAIGCELIGPALSALSAVNASRVASGAPPLAATSPTAIELATCDDEVKSALDREADRAHDAALAERIADLEARIAAGDALADARDATTAAQRKRARVVRKAKGAEAGVVDGGAP